MPLCALVLAGRRHACRRAILLAVLLSSQLAGLFLPVIANAGNEDRPLVDSPVDPAQVHVLVKSHDGRGRTQVRGLSGDGKIRMVGEYSDTTTIRLSIPDIEALEFINGLLELNFFDQPHQFAAGRMRLERRRDGCLDLLTERVMDGSRTSITLTIGKASHEVVLHHPAHGAPEGLRQWVKDYQDFMQVKRGF